MQENPDPAWDNRHLVIVTGKGGTGKSAVAAAMALSRQRQGQKVLAVAMSGGEGLASHLGTPPLSFKPSEVRPGLSAMAVERTKALVEYLQVQIGIPPFVAFGPALRAFDALASAAPAIREIVTIGKVLYEVKTGQWDVVIADAPPTGQIGSYLRAARTITELVPTGRIREQAAWMQDLLSDPSKSSLAIVTLAEELPAAETSEMLTWLGSEKVTGHVVVVGNRLLPPLDAVFDRLPQGPAGDAGRLHLSLVAEQERWLTEVPVDQALPYLFGIMTPPEVAARLADEIDHWQGTAGKKLA